LISLKSIIKSAFKYIKHYRPRPLRWFDCSFLVFNPACSLALRRASSLGAGVGLCGVTAAAAPSICNVSAWANERKRPALATGGGTFPTP
jgi:hypothetical protein